MVSSAKISPSTAADLRVITVFALAAPSPVAMVARRRHASTDAAPIGSPNPQPEISSALPAFAPTDSGTAYRFTVDGSIYSHAAFQGNSKLLLGSLIQECEHLGLSEIIGDSA